MYSSINYRLSTRLSLELCIQSEMNIKISGNYRLNLDSGNELNTFTSIPSHYIKHCRNLFHYCLYIALNSKLMNFKLDFSNFCIITILILLCFLLFIYKRHFFANNCVIILALSSIWFVTTSPFNLLESFSVREDIITLIEIYVFIAKSFVLGGSYGSELPFLYLGMLAQI